ncbi:MAG: spermidine synthase [Pseudomonadota bacterium]|nr:spermidine synthase [Pseudomonadota bacterium]
MTGRIDVSEERGVRYLHFGSTWIQGAMRIARPWALELEYTRDMMVALLLRSDSLWPRNVLAIGLGAGSLPKFLYRYRSRARVHVVEIDPAVITAARHFFRLPPDDPPRLSVELADGDEYVTRGDHEFDLMFVDGFDASGRAGALDTGRFYARARNALGSRGLMVVNLLGRSRGYRASLERIATEFLGRTASLHSPRGNVIVFAAVGDPIELAFAELRRRAVELRQGTTLNLLPSIARLTASVPAGAHGLAL